MKILIVEDHTAVRRSLREWLESAFPQHPVLEAASGEGAVDLALRELPGVIVMDVGLPGMNGLEATRRIKHALPATQVVVLSIHEDEAYVTDALASGASAYVTKGTMYRRLLPALSALLPTTLHSGPS